MCGIIGCKSADAGSSVFEGLKHLEYRGYDSWGIASIDVNKIKLLRKVGKISEAKGELDSMIAIGHTRWATHGKVCEKNAHPHLSNDSKIAVVHNGIIENYSELKDRLKKAGFRFNSETDTEVIPNLVQYFIKKGNHFRDAFRKALLELKGSYAVLIIHVDFDEILFGRKNSPLVVGIKGDEYYIASDINAFLKHTRKVVFVDEEEYGVANHDLYFFDLKTNKPLKKKITEIKWNLEDAKKNGFSHFMFKEILEQSKTIKYSVEQDDKLINKITKQLKSAKNIFLLGCGTSYHACLAAKYLFARQNIHSTVVLASEFEDHESFVDKDSIVIAVSQSGETADLLDAVKIAKNKNAKIVSIVNVVGSTLTRLSDEIIMMNAGPEICVLSTKSYTAQLGIFVLLAHSINKKPSEGKIAVNKAAEAVKNTLDKYSNLLKKIAGKTKSQANYFLIGRGLAYPSALEGALKIKEVSYIHAEGFAGGELKHGTIALIEKGVPVIALVTDNHRDLILSNAMEVKSRGALVIGIDHKPSDVYDYFIKIPDLGDANQILTIIPIQMLAYYLAVARNCDPDRPRNLAKSVTVK